ncbi:MAG: PEP/pyruvate-binding domain-containing protein, partial [Candidatus Methanomethylophilaceae archaeon]|nr:PEP/pyruvate-binding domain-containing protein [Candidatus Methanomethylophilaceae archaeon]
CVIVDAYEMFLDVTGLRNKISDILDATDFDDEDSLEKASAKIKEMIINAEIPGAEIDTLKKELSGMEGRYFAVRSSAVAEDLADASFAGQQDTYLNVEKHDITGKVLVCWSSYWNARAMKYRHDASKDHLSQGMAVVIQKMVSSDISGVMFTSDPVTGEDHTVIEASWGLGESIVSGLVTPDRYVVSGNGEVTEAVIRSKDQGFYLVDGANRQVEIPPEKASARCADDEILKTIAEQGRKLKDRFGCPQDVEWAAENGRVYILQSRAITTLPESSEKDGILWSRGYGDEYWADATTPMFYTVMGKMLTDYVNHEGAHMMGYKDLESGPLTKLHKSRVYFSAAVLERIFAHYPKFIRSRELLEYFPREEQKRISGYPNDYAGMVKSQICLMFRDRDGMIWNTDKVYRRWADGFLKLCGEFDSADLTNLSDEELSEWYYKIRDGSVKHYQLIRYGMVSHSIMTNLLVKNWSAKWLDDDGSIYAGLMSGLEDNKTVETNKGFSDLGVALRNDPETKEKALSMSGGEFVSWLESSDSGFKDVYNKFIRDFGHRSGTRELNAPRWAEDPDYVMNMAVQMCSGDIDLRKEFENGVKRRKETEEMVKQ